MRPCRTSLLVRKRLKPMFASRTYKTQRVQHNVVFKNDSGIELTTKKILVINPTPTLGLACHYLYITIIKLFPPTQDEKVPKWHRSGSIQVTVFPPRRGVERKNFQHNEHWSCYCATRIALQSDIRPDSCPTV